MTDEYSPWFDYVVAGAAFVSSGTGAAGGVGLVWFGRRGVDPTRRRLLSLGVQLCLVVSPLLVAVSTVEHRGFRATLMTCGAVLLFLGMVLTVGALFSPQWVSWLGQAFERTE